MTEYRSILKSSLRLALFLVLVGPGLGCATFRQGTAEPDPEVLGRLQTVIDSFHAGGGFPGVSASVSMPDGSLLNVVAGEADTVRHIPMAPSARMLRTQCEACGLVCGSFPPSVPAGGNTGDTAGPGGDGHARRRRFRRVLRAGHGPRRRAS